VFIRGQFANSKTITRFFTFNPDISRDNEDIVKILNNIFDGFMTGEFNFTLW
jgi:hypothetical protein